MKIAQMILINNRLSNLSANRGDNFCLDSYLSARWKKKNVFCGAYIRVKTV